SDGSNITRVLDAWPQDVYLSRALGAIGMPGLTALYGLEEVCAIKPGESLLLNAATGAVGSLAGQIAKLKGCKVVGSTGSDEKVTVSSLEEALKNASPEGYDCYFEMKHRSRLLSICSSDYVYLSFLGPYPHLQMIFKQLKMEGFLVGRWEHKNEESLKRMLTWVQEGKLKCKEHVTVGFENMPAAFMGMLQGENIRKAIVKV
uniref:Prostaglandin reductase 1 n=1 Tax=Cyprinus carpio TaxID=7962 RepID=A0A8C2EHB5_CYPCA